MRSRVLNGTISQQRGQIGTLQGKVGTLQDQVSTLQTQLSDETNTATTPWPRQLPRSRPPTRRSRPG
jgi:uncharacterized coiled-coil protein SlyX